MSENSLNNSPFTNMITGAILYGNIIYTVGSIIIGAAAQTRSYKLMIGGRVIAALGDIATQVAQYKIFSSWFPPSAGFASTLGIEYTVKRVGAFVGQVSAPQISKVGIVYFGESSD